MNFLDAVQHEPLETVKYFLGCLQDITSVNLQYSYYIAVKTAVTCQRGDVVQLLLEKNCIVNLSDDTPLHIAAKLGNSKIAQLLLEKGASIVFTNEAGDTPLHVAFENKHMEVVDLMLNFIKQSSEYLNLKNKNGLTHLQIACNRTNKAVVEGFLAAASDAIEMIENNSIYKNLGSKTMKQNSIDHLESSDSEDSSQNNYDYCDQFLQSVLIGTAKLKIESASHISNNFDSDQEDSYWESSEFHIVCSERHPDVVRRYIRQGANVNARLKDLDWNGYPKNSTPLHIAVKERQDDNVKVLMEYGADVTLLDTDRATPLHVALYNDDPLGDSETLNLIYKATKDKSVNLMEKNGMSFLHVAASRNDLETVRMYLDKGENVNQMIGKDEYYGVSYFTPLHFAAQYHHQEMVELLIQHGANVNSPSIDGLLHVACKSGHQGIIELLLLHGARADRMAGVWRDKTPLHLLLKHISDYQLAKVNASDCKDQKGMVSKDFSRKLQLFYSCFDKLLEAGCDINAKDEDGNTALHYAYATQLFHRISIQKILWRGADINIENRKGETPVMMRNIEWYDGIADDFMVHYHHVQELKALGVEVNPKNEEFCKKLAEKKDEWSKHKLWEYNGKVLTDEELAKREKERLNELEKMKNVMLTKTVSLYDFVKFKPTSTGVTAKNEKLRSIMEGTMAEEQYPVYWYRILLHLNKDLQILEKGVAVKSPKRKSRLKGKEAAMPCKRACV